MKKRGKKFKHKGTPRRQLSARFTEVITAHMTERATQEDADHLMIPAREALHLLRNGGMKLQHFIELNESVIAAFCVAKNAHAKAANDETRDILTPSADVFYVAIEGLQAVAERMGDSGVYAATDEELQAVDQALEWFEALILISTKGEIAAGLLDSRDILSDMPVLQGETWRNLDGRLAA